MRPLEVAKVPPRDPSGWPTIYGGFFNFALVQPLHPCYLPSVTRLRHFDNLSTARFVTFSCFEHRSFLTKRGNIRAVLEQIDRIRSDEGMKVLGYVIMPDHVHMVLLPAEGTAMGPAIGRLKALSARKILAVDHDTGGVRNDGRRAIWQRRCYDHNCRTPQTVIEKIEYCHYNPVRAGLVEHPADWEWSSYSWYAGSHHAPIQIDSVEM